jgi:hypothetical protein
VHIGHRYLISELRRAAILRDLPSVVITFPEHSPILRFIFVYHPRTSALIAIAAGIVLVKIVAPVIGRIPVRKQAKSGGNIFNVLVILALGFGIVYGIVNIINTSAAGNAAARAEDEQAIAELTEAIDLNPDDAAAYFWRGISYRDQDDDEHAIEDWTKAIGLNPNYTLAYYERGRGYYRLDDYERAIEDLTVYVTLQDTYVSDVTSAYYALANIHISMGEFDLAIEDYNAAFSRNPFQDNPSQRERYRENIKKVENARKKANK